jgi:hypothetical protein
MKILNEEVRVVVAWHDQQQIQAWLKAWGVPVSFPFPDWLVLQHDAQREGCAVTKNKGVAEAIRRGADIVVVLDDDCLPGHLTPALSPNGGEGEREGALGIRTPVQTLQHLAQLHVEALQPQEIEMILPVTNPISRGTPYRARTVKLPVAASMGFWTEVGDYDAASQLVYGATHPMEFKRIQVTNQYFSLCGMNLAYRPKDWLPWCEFINVPRFDDIWMGWLWQREAYRRGYCFNLNGPLVRHSRQSNVWKNLQLEAVHLEWNETGWAKIATTPYQSYGELRRLLPV